MKRMVVALLPMLWAAMDCRADNCEAIKAQVEARFRAGGLADVSLAVVDGASPPAGRVVGTCGNGARQIVVVAPGKAAVAPTAASAAASVAAAPRTAASGSAASGDAPSDKIPTECKDGSIVIGPDCNDPRAVRLTSSELSKLVATPP